MKSADDILEKYFSIISAFSIDPVNEHKERRKLEKGYNPQFSYDVQYSKAKKHVRELKKLNTGAGVLGKAFREQKERYIKRLQLFASLGDEKNFTKCSLKVFGRPSPSLIARAKRLVKLPHDRKREKKISTKEVVGQIRFAFYRYGVNWRVAEKQMIASAAVNVSKKELYIKKNTRFSEQFLKRLIIHEIGTHILRAENGALQPYKIFAYGFPDFLPTEEGLAVVNEELNGVLSNNTLRVYAGRVLAINKALKSSFWDTYNYLLKYFEKDSAWRLAVRAKRGLSDTSKPGAYTKDYLYLKGYYDIKEYMHNGGDVSKLYYGRIGLNELSLIDKLPELHHPDFLPLFRYFAYFARLFDDASHIVFIAKPLLYPVEFAYGIAEQLLKTPGEIIKSINPFLNYLEKQSSLTQKELEKALKKLKI